MRVRKTKWQRSIEIPMEILSLAHFRESLHKTKKCCRCQLKKELSEFASSHSPYCHPCRYIVVEAKKKAGKILTKDERELLRAKEAVPDMTDVADEIMKLRINGRP